MYKGPLQCRVLDFFPAILPQRVVSAPGKLFVLGHDLRLPIELEICFDDSRR